MTFDDENKPKSQDIPNTQVPQASGDEVEPQSGAVGANAGGLEEMDAKEAAVQLGTMLGKRIPKRRRCSIRTIMRSGIRFRTLRGRC